MSAPAQLRASTPHMQQFRLFTLNSQARLSIFHDIADGAGYQLVLCQARMITQILERTSRARAFSSVVARGGTCYEWRLRGAQIRPGALLTAACQVLRQRSRGRLHSSRRCAGRRALTLVSCRRAPSVCSPAALVQ